MNNVVVTGGDPRGYTAGVDSTGNLLAKVSGSVETTRAKVELASSPSVLVGTTSTEVLASRVGRTAVHGVNHGPDKIYLKFGGAATSDDYMVAAGGSFAFDVVGEEVLNGIAPTTASRLAVIEWKKT